MFQSRTPKSSPGVHHTRKFCLCIDASRDTRCSHVLNTQVPKVIAERVIHILSNNGWMDFLPEPMNFLVNMPNHPPLAKNFVYRLCMLHT